MKISLLIAVMIVVVGGLLGWRQHERLIQVREVHRQVVAEAEALGVSTSTTGEARVGGPKLAEREQSRREEQARSVARELIEFSKEMKGYEERGEQPDEEMQKRIVGMIAKFLDLDPSQLKMVIAELREDSEIDDEMRRGIVGFSIMMLANEHPEAALALFSGSPDLVDGEGMGRSMVSSALGKWATEDPLGALAWIREHEEAHPEVVNDQAKGAVIAGAARQDLKLALGLIGDLGLAEPQAGAHLASGVVGAEQRTALLEALREHDREDLSKGALAAMASQMGNEGFESSRQWLEDAELSAEETSAFVGGLNSWQVKKDTGAWIEWIGEASGDGGLAKVNELMSGWTRDDHRAAGTWLSGAEDGPVKSAAVKSYAETVAPYEPEAAAEWARTLPAGEDRRELAERIHQEWKAQDEAAAAAFAAEWGLE